MTQLEINTIEHAGRSAMAWSPEGSEGRFPVGSLLGAILPILGILAVGAVLLLVIF
jgi:hypothetical protein